MNQLGTLAVWCLETAVRAHVSVGIRRECRDPGRHLYKFVLPMVDNKPIPLYKPFFWYWRQAVHVAYTISNSPVEGNDHHWVVAERRAL